MEPEEAVEETTEETVEEEMAKKKEKSSPKKGAKSTQQELAQATTSGPHDLGISVLQFVRTENLGILKEGFQKHVSSNGLGGKRPRYEWKRLFEEYRNEPRKITC